MDYSYLLDFCETDSQKAKVEALIQHKTFGETAKALNMTKSSVWKTIKQLKFKASKQGLAPEYNMLHSVPDGFNVKGVSSYYNRDGELTGQWVKSQSDNDRRAEQLIERLEAFEWTPAPVIEYKNDICDSDLCSLFTITDFHLGMYCYHKETGDNWDTDIAVKELTSAVTQMCNGSPNSEIGILNLQGDFLHWSKSLESQTESGHILDTDTRFSRLVDVALDVIMHSVEIMLNKFKTVKVIVCEGNHDIVGSVWVRKAIKKIYQLNNRVIIDDTDFPFYAHLHGDIMLGFHHGHKVKNQKLPELFASEPRYRQMWGNAKYTYIHTGHYHHTEQQQSECGGAIVERHPTLAGRDAYATRGGYNSWRSAHAITYHKKFGEYRRVTVTPKLD